MPQKDLFEKIKNKRMCWREVLYCNSTVFEQKYVKLDVRFLNMVPSIHLSVVGTTIGK